MLAVAPLEILRAQFSSLVLRKAVSKNWNEGSKYCELSIWQKIPPRSLASTKYWCVVILRILVLALFVLGTAFPGGRPFAQNDIWRSARGLGTHWTSRSTGIFSLSNNIFQFVVIFFLYWYNRSNFTTKKTPKSFTPKKTW